MEKLVTLSTLAEAQLTETCLLQGRGKNADTVLLLGLLSFPLLSGQL